MHTIYLTGGAAVDPDWLRTLAAEGVFFAGVDSGTIQLAKAGIIPEIAFGDFDSVTEEEWRWIEENVKEIHTAQPEKDETDMEMALKWAVTQGVAITMIGVTGQRLDHFFGNVQLLLHKEYMKSGIMLELADPQNRITCFGSGEHAVARDDHYPYLSIIPMTPEVQGLTMRGVKYPTTDLQIGYGQTLTISNEITEEKASIRLSSGIIMVIRSRD